MKKIKVLFTKDILDICTCRLMPVTHGPSSWMRYVVCDFGSTSWM